MAIVQSFETREVLLKSAIQTLESALELNKQAERLERVLRQQGVAPSVVDDQVQGLLEEMKDLIDEVQGASGDGNLAAINEQYAIRVEIGMPAAYTSVVIDVDNGSSKAVLTAANSSTPFSPFAEDDVIEILSPENAANAQLKAAEGTPGNTLTFSSVMSGGSDNPHDETLVLVLRER